MSKIEASSLTIVLGLGLVGLPYVSHAQSPECGADDRQCLEDSLARECGQTELANGSCLAWLEQLEEDALAASPEWQLIAASGYFRVADFSSSEEDAKTYRERSHSIYLEILAKWPDGYFAAQAYTGLSNLSDDLDDRIRYLLNASQADPGNGNIAYLLAGNLARRGQSDDYGKAAELYRVAYLAGVASSYSAANAMRLYLLAGQADEAVKLKSQVATSIGIADFAKQVASAQFAQDLKRAKGVLDTACGKYVIEIFGPETCISGIDRLVAATRSNSVPVLRQAAADVATDAMSRLNVSEIGTVEERRQREYDFGLILREWIDTGVASARVYVAWAQHPESDLNESIAALERAVQLAPDNGRYRYWLAQGYIAQGKFDEAIEHLTLARDNLPENVGITPESVAREISRAESARDSGQ